MKHYMKIERFTVRKFDVGDKVSILDFSKYRRKRVVRYFAFLKEGRFNYQVEIGNKMHQRHIDQMRSTESDIPLSSPELDSSFPSIPEVSSISPSDKELLLVFPAPTGEVEPRPVELKPSNAMTPEQRFESSIVNPNTV
ncbi:hypothetical protein AVEN_213113-1 [Araneus ventricosus]|uniref:Uncharacterized protein n=1 Tax=Araneus ventricosus TaxID=182803 RepID=A0A4Y2N1K9_ARAVE|nr:hypothetical protein AVEN_213113-1 [Araneus ventricosus]